MKNIYEWNVTTVAIAAAVAVAVATDKSPVETHKYRQSHSEWLGKRCQVEELELGDVGDGEVSGVGLK